MTYFVVRNRHSNPGSLKGWKRIAIYNIHKVDTSISVPDDILVHYLNSKKSLFGYVGLDGLTQKQLLTLTSLIKGRKVRAIVNRWGDIGAYKILGT